MPAQSWHTSVNALQIERRDEGAQHVPVEMEGIDRILHRLVGAAKSQQIGRDDR